MGTLDMEFDVSKLKPEELTVMERIEEELISILKTENSSDYIRFWEPNERIPDSEIEKQYPTIYSVALTTEYKKKFNKSIFTQPIVAKNWLYMNNFLANSAYIQLSLEEQNKLIIWSKAAYRVISRIFKAKFNYHLKAVRFDFLPQENGLYEIPYLPLCNIRLSKSEKEKKIIPIYDYIADITDLFKLIEQMHSYSEKENPPEN